MRIHPLSVAVACIAVACAPATARVNGLAPVLTRAVLRASIDSLLADPMWRNSHTGILVVEPTSGDTLYSRNAGKLFMPASNQKILTGAAALALLGPDHRFSTEFYAGAPVAGGVLTGDLIVAGRGDPSVSDAVMGDAMLPLRAAVESLYARGVREIAGSLVKGGNAFPDTTIGEWDWDDLDTPSGAAVDELFFNNGVARIRLYGGERPGEAVRVVAMPARAVVAIDARVATSDPGAAPAEGNGTSGGGRGGGGRGGARNGAIRFETDVTGRHHVVRLSGWVAPRDSVNITVALRDPASAWLNAFAQALAERGIILRGGTVRTPDAPTAGLTPLFTLKSAPLSDIMPRFMKPSQNQIGEMLLRAIALEKTGVGSIANGRRLIEQQMHAFGADTAGVVVRDGSGLSRHDYVTPESIVRVLDAMRKRPDFQLWYDALPIAGVDGTVANRMRNTPAQGNLRAKTGTVNRSRALSGYVTTADQRLLIFSFQANNYTVPNAQVERVQDWIAVRLASSPLPTK